MSYDQHIPSAFSPLRHRSYAVLWTASTLSFTGTWMHEVGAGWQMAQLTQSPLLIALVQTSTSLPIFLFALLAGALADRADRRQYLIIVNSFNAVVAGCLAILAANEALTPLRLLVLTGLLGTGIAFIAPAWQSVVPTLIPRTQLAQALALNSLGINLSRAIGPAIASLLIIIYGVSAPFLANGASFLIVVAAVVWWQPETAAAPANGNQKKQSIVASIKEGLWHVRENTAFKMTLLRSFGFFLFASSFWALMPVLAVQLGSSDNVLLGQFISAVGLGAVMGALLLPRLRARYTINTIAFAGAFVMALILMALAPAAALSWPANLVAAFCFIGGMGWICVLTSLHLSAQTALPDWVRARGLSVNLMIFFGSMATGSAIWGQVTALFELMTAYLAAGLALIVGQFFLKPARLGAAFDQQSRPASSP